jgi:hypothetical protein
VVPAGIRSVESVPVKIEVADQRMTHMVDSEVVTDFRAVPHLAKTFAALGQVSY